MPTYNDSHTDEGSDEGMFCSTLTGLAPSTTYFVREYALSSTDTVYSGAFTFTTLASPNVNDGQPCQGTPTLTDIDGNVYNTVQIGQQCWMKENLRTTKYPNNTPIMHGNSYSTTDSYWYYPNNSSSNKPTYGLLYTWPAVMNGASTSNTNPSGVPGICPDGWHIPSDAEWNQLLDYAQGIWAWQCTGGSSGKSLASTIGWENSDNACALGNHPEINNASGFGATPSGEYYSGGFSSFGRISEYWTSSSLQHNVGFQYNQHFVILHTSGGNLGRAYSVRCYLLLLPYFRINDVDVAVGILQNIAGQQIPNIIVLVLISPYSCLRKANSRHIGVYFNRHQTGLHLFRRLEVPLHILNGQNTQISGNKMG